MGALLSYLSKAGLPLPGLRDLMAAMAKEIERKFLLKDDGWRAHVHATVAIRQFYIVVEPDRSVRVRIKDGDKAVLTVKAGGQALVRDEFEYEIPLADAEAMRNYAVRNMIEKTRHLVDHAGFTYEVDVFEGVFAGLVIAELETPETVAQEDLPAWLGREVTGDPAYYNASLALQGAPERTA